MSLPSAEYRLCVAITGASGSLYAEVLLRELLKKVPTLDLVVSKAAKAVIRYELFAHDGPFSLVRCLADNPYPQVKRWQVDDLFAPIASGSSVPTHLIVVPCSMGSLARIALGQSSNLIERAADVVLKQKQRLLICPRETPLHAIHLRHMLTLAELGCDIVPLMPGFYHRPETLESVVEFMVGRILELISLPHRLYTPWQEKQSLAYRLSSV